ncbi:sulfatase [Enterobacter cloacae]|uniref:Sulfatase n=1 Tax=Enterobacter cloacae TaxID=550 RepID=A0A377M8T6_ENTCL|nr:sulfatase [Enterobacter cloacae]
MCFLKSHGFDHLYGSEELKTTVADPTYRNDWGFYDDTVLEETWEKIRRTVPRRETLLPLLP